MLGEAALKGFIPAAVMPERSPFFIGEGIFPSKTVPRPGEADAEPFFCIFNGTLGKERKRKAFPESQGSVFSGRCVPTES